jgi:cell division protein FtsL
MKKLISLFVIINLCALTFVAATYGQREAVAPTAKLRPAHGRYEIEHAE